MSLKSVFIAGVKTAFATFNEAVKNASYIVETDNGFEDATSEEYPVRVILDKFSQEDVSTLAFPQIQPTDSKAMIPGEDLPVPMNTENKLKIGERTFTIIAFETDPYEALFTLQVRDTK